MSSATTIEAPRSSRKGLTADVKRIITLVAVVVVLIAMFLSTKIVPKGTTVGQGPAAFSAAAYGAKQFPIQQSFIAAHAVDAVTLGAAVKKNHTAAAQKYGVPVNGGASVEVPVKFTGVVGKVPAAGYTSVKVRGLQSGQLVNVQLGPAINGTDLRDATGKAQLGQFENQIQFQDAASAINTELKKVLTKAGAPNLTGKTVTVTGVFSLVNPKVWNVTPSNLVVQ